MNCLLFGNGIVSQERIQANTGLVFTQNVFMYLHAAGNFALKKYGRDPKSNGTSITLIAYLRRIKKGSGKFRKILERDCIIDVGKLRVVKTFFELAGCGTPDNSNIEKFMVCGIRAFLQIGCGALHFSSLITHCQSVHAWQHDTAMPDRWLTSGAPFALKAAVTTLTEKSSDTCLLIVQR